MREVTLRVEDLDSFFEGALAMGRRLDEGANKVGVAKLAFESMAALLKLWAWVIGRTDSRVRSRTVSAVRLLTQPLTRPCMRSFLSRGKFAWCLAPGGASGVRSRPTPARRNLGGAKCRWPDACQGRSRRRRWPKASLYKGLASDDDRRPRSVGRDYAHLSLELSPLPRA